MKWSDRPQAACSSHFYHTDHICSSALSQEEEVAAVARLQSAVFYHIGHKEKHELTRQERAERALSVTTETGEQLFITTTPPAAAHEQNMNLHRIHR